MSEATGDFLQVIEPGTTTRGISQSMVEEYLLTLDDDREEERYETDRTRHELCLLDFFEWLSQR